MKKNILKIALLLIPVIILGAGLYYIGVEPETAVGPTEKPTTDAAPHIDPNSSVSIEGFKLIDQEFDKTRMTVTARRAALTTRRIHRFYRLAIGNVVEMDAPSFVIADEKGGTTSITSTSAIVDPAKKEVFFTGGCVIKAPDGSELSSDTVQWKYAKGRLELKDGYTLKKGGHEKKGERFSADLRLNKLNDKLF